jgi:hypothetical protein
MAGPTIPRHHRPRRGPCHLPPYPTQAEWENYAHKVLWPFTQLLWSGGKLDEARTYPVVVGMRGHLQALQAGPPAKYRHAYRRYHMALSGHAALVIACTRRGSGSGGHGRPEEAYWGHPAPE